eukprot:CAMPEP_0182421058 /NCGR_PEP_ID=MMETSP1167-20130531/6260_1 /TAXON_ID=2988 /ORGANISM="Mallomonas Sp, Strain CCMP3275" /LENGTH=187 /DNA_ID=CAMNT_0024597799 /DNA_START=183 /DNA_END=742 /DNA_ORIENTATION=+
MAFWKPGAKPPPSDADPISGQRPIKNEVLEKPDENSTTQTVLQSPPLQKDDVTSRLSKGVLSMKFMKRKIESDSQLREEAQKRRRALESQWSNETTESTHSTAQNNILICERDDEDLMASFPGRRSFRGCNPIVERQYQAAIDASKYEHYLDNNSKNTKDVSNVSDQEMTDRFQDLIGLPRGPNQGR